MKKFLAIVLCLCLMFTMSITALATTTGGPTTGSGETGGPTTGGTTTGGTTTGGTTTGGTTTGGTTTGSGETGGDDTTGGTTGGSEVVDVPFTDVEEGRYYTEAVAWAYANGIVAGTSATTFAPEKSCTRAEAVTFLWRAAGQPAATITSHSFTDVNENAYYYKALLWGVENGIVYGTSTTTFEPDTVCNRAQIATFLYRASGASGSGSHSFTDVVAGSYYADAVAWAAANGITAGVTATSFAPGQNCNRAQMVTFLYRACN